MHDLQSRHDRGCALRKVNTSNYGSSNTSNTVGRDTPLIECEDRELWLLLFLDQSTWGVMNERTFLRSQRQTRDTTGTSTMACNRKRLTDSSELAAMHEIFERVG